MDNNKRKCMCDNSLAEQVEVLMIQITNIESRINRMYRKLIIEPQVTCKEIYDYEMDCGKTEP